MARVVSESRTIADALADCESDEDTRRRVIGVGLVVLWATLGATSSLVFLYGVVMLVRRCPQLAEVDAKDPSSWPTLSVVVPARDEALTIDPAVASLLAQDFPNLQVVLVDDRSTDATGTVIDRLAAKDSRVAAVHVRELPDGWLGKLNAIATEFCGGVPAPGHSYCPHHLRMSH